MIPQNWRESIDKLAEDRISEASHLRMLITALVAANWVTLQMILLYVTDLVPGRDAVQMSVFATMVVFAVYFVVSRVPTIAQNIQRIGGLRD